MSDDERGTGPPADNAEALVARFQQVMGQLRQQMARVIVGQDDSIEQLLITVLVGGNCLITGLPGTAKTLMVRSLAQALGLTFKRIQFTPDLMPSDVTGTDIIEEDGSGQRRWRFVQGPIFTQVLLADEINRTPPKTQSALLEAMQELSVTVRGNTYRLQPPFVVLATQNPIELEGTYPLPEAQLDRFLFNVVLDYLDGAQEQLVVERNAQGMSLPEPEAVTHAEEVVAFQHLVRQVPIADDINRYAVALVRASRPSDAAAPALVKKYVSYGASVRAAIHLTLAARARALLRGRYHVQAEDVAALAPAVLRHRLFRNYLADSDDVSADALVDDVIKAVRA